jgi:hypothetical protein
VVVSTLAYVEHYLAERYLSPRSGIFLAEDVARVQAVAAGRARLLQTLYVPDDEICFYLFESESAELVEQAGVAAGLDLTRVQRVSVA